MQAHIKFADFLCGIYAMTSRRTNSRLLYHHACLCLGTPNREALLGPDTAPTGDEPLSLGAVPAGAAGATLRPARAPRWPGPKDEAARRGCHRRVLELRPCEAVQRGAGLGGRARKVLGGKMAGTVSCSPSRSRVLSRSWARARSLCRFRDASGRRPNPATTLRVHRFAVVRHGFFSIINSSRPLLPSALRKLEEGQRRVLCDSKTRFRLGSARRMWRGNIGALMIVCKPPRPLGAMPPNDCSLLMPEDKGRPETNLRPVSAMLLVADEALHVGGADSKGHEACRRSWKDTASACSRLLDNTRLTYQRAASAARSRSGSRPGSSLVRETIFMCACKRGSSRSFCVHEILASPSASRLIRTESHHVTTRLIFWARAGLCQQVSAPWLPLVHDHAMGSQLRPPALGPAPHIRFAHVMSWICGLYHAAFLDRIRVMDLSWKAIEWNGVDESQREQAEDR